MARSTAELTQSIKDKNDQVIKFWDDAGDDDVPAAKRQDVITLNKEIEALELELKERQDNDALRSKAQQRNDWLSKPTSGPVFPGAQDVKATPLDIRTAARRSLGDQFVESEQFKGWLSSISQAGRIGDHQRIGNSPPVPVTGLNLKALITGLSDTSAGAFVANDVQPFVELPTRPLTIRDIITVGQTDSDTVEFVRMVSFTNNAAPVAEATDVSGGSGVKPQSDMALEKVTTPVKTIAHWEATTKRALSDASQIRTLVDTFLRYGLEEELEDQIINGDGIGENLIGIFNTTGTTTQAWDTDILITTRKARTKVKTVGRANANAYVMAPLTWEFIDLLKDNEARYYFGGPSVMGTPRLWGLPVVESEGLPTGFSLVGDFRQCVLWDRMQAAITASDSHADFFIRNLVAILAELRAAFGIRRPAAIVEIDTTA